MPYPRLHGAADGVKGVGVPIIDDSHDVLTGVAARFLYDVMDVIKVDTDDAALSRRNTATVVPRRMQVRRRS